ncbi:hypothetical protein BDA99DRAFT_513135 [Phascolomyces articulosus]|uniref:AAA+ ATPase domain-containing protein n=1 Tax=Phascolomyces articulosus TaxID=60185 RepID=A0AAD5JYY1_9FUNG|nr:hypothetical protein BDA99DRAFT_513135 [Phascolomyces articulosus]
MTITDANGGGEKALHPFFTKMQPKTTYKVSPTKHFLSPKKNKISTSTTTTVTPTSITSMTTRNKKNNDTMDHQEQQKENKKPRTPRITKKTPPKKQQYTSHFIKARQHQLRQLQQEQKEKLEKYPPEGSTTVAKRYAKYQQVLRDQQRAIEEKQLHEKDKSHLSFEEQLYLDIYGPGESKKNEEEQQKKKKPVYMQKGPTMWPDKEMFEGGHIRQETQVLPTPSSEPMELDHDTSSSMMTKHNTAFWNSSYRRSTSYVRDIAKNQGRTFFESMAVVRSKEQQETRTEKIELQENDQKQYAVRNGITVAKTSRKKQPEPPSKTNKRSNNNNKEEKDQDQEIILLSHADVADLMDRVYQESHWKDTPACQALYQSLFDYEEVDDDNNGDGDDKDDDDLLMDKDNVGGDDWNQLPWTEKHRPTSIIDLLVNQRAHNYLLEWLQQLKVQSPISEEVTATQHQARKRRRRLQQEASPDLAFEELTLDDEELEEEDDEWDYPHSEEKKDDSGSDFEMSGTKKKRQSQRQQYQRKRSRKEHANNKKKKNVRSNLMLVFGPHGVGKTTSVYTAAQQVGYEVFEINPGMRRAGKDLMAAVGEMTKSHQVNFLDHASASLSSSSQQQQQQQQQQQPAEPIIDKSQKDISSMFQKITSPKKRSQEEEKQQDSTNNKKRRMAKESSVVTKKKTKSNGIMSHFGRIKTSRNVSMEEEEDKATSSDWEDDMDYKMHHEQEEVPNQWMKQPLASTKQSLILLEEVDLLFDDDKGFWTAVLELAQTSKRPIIMTCNDTDMVPIEAMKLEKAIEIHPQTTHSLIPYLQLVCFKEGYAVNPMDLFYLVATMGSDLRQLIHTLEVWCKQLNPLSRMNARTRNSGALGATALRRTLSSSSSVVEVKKMVARRKNRRQQQQQEEQQKIEQMTDEDFTKEGKDPPYQKEFRVCPRIFNQYMGTDSQDLVLRMTTMEMERDEPSLLELCQFYQHQQENDASKENDRNGKGKSGKLFTVKQCFNSSDLGIISRGLDTMAFSDTWITRQSNQCQVIMEQATSSEVKDQICGYQGTIQMIGNRIEPELYEVENKIQQLNMKRVAHRKWQVEIQQRAGIWGGLCYNRTTTYNESIEATKRILNWRLVNNPVCSMIMTEYVPYIRAMCQVQQELLLAEQGGNDDNDKDGRRKRALLRKNGFKHKINDESIELLLRKRETCNLTHQWHIQATVYNDRWKDAAKGKKKLKIPKLSFSATQKKNGT